MTGCKDERMKGATNVDDRNRRRQRRGGFAFQELLVVLMVIGMLVAFLVPMLRAARQRSYGLQCADHLRQIGQGLLHYMAVNDRKLPSTRVDAAAKAAWGTGAAAADPFSEAGPAANDVTAGPFLMLRLDLVPAGVFICPLTDDVEDDFARSPRGALGRSNFTNLDRNLSYSFAHVRPDGAAASSQAANYRKLGAGDLAYAADRNPGIRTAAESDDDPDDVTQPAIEASASVMRLGNSNNHAKTGQNVLYMDGRVAWSEHPLAGCLDDNIYTRAAGPAGAATDRADPLSAPRDVMDSLLLPTDDQ